MKKIIRQESGMTLVELLVSLVISSFIIAGIYGVYTVQKKSYTVQEQVAEMQQRLRSAMDFLVRDIRMAGSNPDMESKCGTKISTPAKADNMVFRACNLKEDDDDFEITVIFNKSEQNLSLVRDKLDTGTPNPMPIAEGVDNFEIQYLDRYGTPIPTPVTTSGDINRIRAVQISMLIRSTYPDMKYTDTNTYEMGSGATWSVSTSPSYENKEHYHRRLLVTTIQLRNMLQQ